MPKIETKDSFFYSLLSKKYKDDDLINIFPIAKAELDGREGDTLKIELNDTNRPDLWSAAGLARAIRCYREGRKYKYNFFSRAKNEKESQGRYFINHESAVGIRDFSIGFACRGVKVNDDLLKTLIQSQEKLCTNFGRKRRTIAIGIYRSALIKFPVHYAAVDPDKTKFIPLGMDEELSLREICEKHPKGKEYGHIVSSFPLFPHLYDDNGETLSFPPVINSASLGAVEVGDSAFFVEFSGPIIEDLLLSASILSCDMADMGFEILPVKVRLSKDTKYGREITVPFYFQEEMAITLNEVEKKLGVSLTKDQCVKALSKMGVESRAEGDKIIASCPEYRNDFLHPADLAEDIMIGYGLENFTPVLPSDFTIGRLSDAENFLRGVKEILTGLGFQEMMYNYLGSKRDFVTKMHISDESVVMIDNPMSENYEALRPSVLPSLLESESVSGHAEYPHRIYESGKICVKDKNDNSSTKTINSIGLLISDVKVGYNDISSYVNTIMYFLSKEYTLAPLLDDPRFIKGRAARVIVGKEEVAIFGEVSPEVLESWNSTMPTVAAEFNADALML